MKAEKTGFQKTLTTKEILHIEGTLLMEPVSS